MASNGCVALTTDMLPNQNIFMNPAEIQALYLCKDYFRNDVDPIYVSSSLLNAGHFKSDDFSDIVCMFKEGKERHCICEYLISQLPFCVNLDALITIVDKCGYKALAAKLFITYMKVNCSGPVHVQKSCSGQRPSVHAFFRRLKRMVHDAQFDNPRLFLRQLANRFEDKMRRERHPVRQQQLADECVAVIGAEIDAIAITFDDNLSNHEVFSQMKRLIPKTSNTLIFDVQYYGRLANANAIVGRFADGENMMVAARCKAYMAGPCLELVNMLYIEVYVKLWQYERSPTKSLQDALLMWGRIGLESLEEEEMDTKVLWRRMFILRMVFCHLGLGNRANVIVGCQVNESNIAESKDLLADIDKNWTGIETRRQMFYYVARARLSEVTHDISQCLHYLRKAYQLAADGHFSEIEFINEYRHNMVSLAESQVTGENMEIVRNSNFVEPLSRNFDSNGVRMNELIFPDTDSMKHVNEDDGVTDFRTARTEEESDILELNMRVVSHSNNYTDLKAVANEYDMNLLKPSEMEVCTALMESRNEHNGDNIVESEGQLYNSEVKPLTNVTEAENVDLNTIVLFESRGEPSGSSAHDGDINLQNPRDYNQSTADGQYDGNQSSRYTCSNNNVSHLHPDSLIDDDYLFGDGKL